MSRDPIRHAALAASLIAIVAACAQESAARGGRGGGGMRGGGVRGGGSMSISRPSGGGGFSRPSGGSGFSRPSGGSSRPSAGQLPAGSRPGVGDRPGGGGERPSQLPVRGNGEIGGGGNIDIDGGWGHWDDHIQHPIAAGAVIGATAALTAAAIGSYYDYLPGDCSYYPYSGASYYWCGGAYYEPRYEGDQVVYVVVEDPHGGNAKAETGQAPATSETAPPPASEPPAAEPPAPPAPGR